jgi:hypothetical protein
MISRGKLECRQTAKYEGRIEMEMRENFGEEESFGERETSPNPPEGTITKRIESVTAPIPSSVYLSLAISAMGASLFLMLAGRKDTANFVGQWAPAILIMGLYNKMVKQHGSD